MNFGAIKKNKMFCVIRNFNLHNELRCLAGKNFLFLLIAVAQTEHNTNQKESAAILSFLFYGATFQFQFARISCTVINSLGHKHTNRLIAVFECFDKVQK